MSKMRLPLVVVSLALLSAACAAGGSPPTGSAGPNVTPPPGAIDHPTGATDVVLRLEEGGGFVPIEFVATQAPIFTLYGDGRVIFQQATDVFVEPGPDGLSRAGDYMGIEQHLLRETFIPQIAGEVQHEDGD